MNLDEVLQRVEEIFEREDGEEFAEHLIKAWRDKREISTLIGDSEYVFRPLKKGVRVRGDGINEYYPRTVIELCEYLLKNGPWDLEEEAKEKLDDRDTVIINVDTGESHDKEEIEGKSGVEEEEQED